MVVLEKRLKVKSTKKHLKKKPKIRVGWREWCALPTLGLPAIKVKLDTGAKTSSLHAFNIKPFMVDGRAFVRFEIHPIQKDTSITITHIAPLMERRKVRSSTGHSQHRYVILTPIELGGKVWEIEITLANRDIMGYRMLLGRQAMRKWMMVDPGASFLMSRMSNDEAYQLYDRLHLAQTRDKVV